jgi:hypothetical protein
MAVKRSGMHRVDAGRLPNHSLSLSILVPASSLILPFMVNAPPYRAKGLSYRHAVLVFALSLQKYNMQFLRLPFFFEVLGSNTSNQADTMTLN